MTHTQDIPWHFPKFFWRVFFDLPPSMWSKTIWYSLPNLPESIISWMLFSYQTIPDLCDFSYKIFDELPVVYFEDANDVAKITLIEYSSVIENHAQWLTDQNSETRSGQNVVKRLYEDPVVREIISKAIITGRRLVKNNV